MTRDGKATKYISFCLLTILLGFAAGGIVWVILQIMQIGIGLIWTAFPTALGLGPGVLGVLLYNLIVCFIGALFIALGQKHYGRLPDTMEEVLGRVKKTGHYPYSNLHHIAIAALFPLLFGGALGPEAGLTGLVVGLCYWIGDNLKYRNEEITALAEAGFAAVVGVIFGSPLFGIAHNLEPDDRSDMNDPVLPEVMIQLDDVIANQAPLDFDVSVKDIYSAMLTGAKLVLVPRPLFTTPAPLLDFLCDQNTTVMIWAVSALCLISAFHGLEYRVPGKVRLVMFSGEVMPLKRLKNWMDYLPQTDFINLYGPTEITCNCTWHRIDRQRDYTDGIPIGESFPNEETFLLNEKDEEILVPGETGEICVRGTAVGLGYWNMKEQTRERFRDDPRTPEYSSVIYCTGDLGRYNEQGELMFLGRADDQVKYMGHRIELAEVELAMNGIPGVERSCCVFDEQKSRLHGFYCGSVDRKELAGLLKDRLPVFMIPGYLHQVQSMPVTGRGKIDRKALMEGLHKKG